MKTLVLLLTLVVTIASTGMIATGAEKQKAPKETKRLHHVVAFKFKKSATAAQIAEVEEAFRALKKKIPVIVDLEWGTNVSPEKHDKGFTHGFLLTFKSDKDRDAYLNHPDHQAFGKLVGPVLDDVFVIDFWGKK